MDSTRQSIAVPVALARRAELVALAQAATTPRERSTAWRAVKAADVDVDFAVREHVKAARALMLGRD